MTTFEDAARAEILSRLGWEVQKSDGERRVTAFMAGAVWARDHLAAQEPTDVEAAAESYARTPRMNVGTVRDRIAEAYIAGWVAARARQEADG